MKEKIEQDKILTRLTTEEELSRIAEAAVDADWLRAFDEAALHAKTRQLKIEWEIRNHARFLYPIAMSPIAEAILSVRRSAPPPLGYLDWIMRPKDAADVRANLDDMFEQWIERHGEEKARKILKWQGLRLTISYVIDHAVNRVGQFAKLLRFGF